MKSFTEYKFKLAGLTVGDAFEVLFNYGLEDMTIQETILGSFVRYTTIWDFCKKYKDKMFASKTGLFTFYGGPDQTLETQGTLFTLVLDQIMYHDALKERESVGV